MKNLTKIFLAVVALFAYACVTDTTEDLGVKLGGQTEITLSLEESRTQLGAKAEGVYPLFWSEGDAISVNGVASTALTAQQAGASAATFTIDGTVAAPYCIAYPAAPAGQVLFAENQVHAGNGTFGNGVSTMYAYGSTEGVQLNHLTGVLKIGVTGADKLTFAQISTADRAPIAGAFALNFESGELEATATASSVINYSFGEGVQLSGDATYIHVAVPAGVYDELYVTLYDVNGGVMYATVKAGESKPLAVGTVREFSAPIVYTANSNVFVVRDAASLKAFAEAVNEANSFYTQDVLMVADVDMTGEEWTSLNWDSARMNTDGDVALLATFHGNGYAIKGLTAPLFDTLTANVKGLHLRDVNINESVRPNVGALARWATARTLTEKDTRMDTLATASQIAKPTISHCSAKGELKVDCKEFTYDANRYKPAYAPFSIGGLIAVNFSCDVMDCVNEINMDIDQIVADGNTTALHPWIGGVVGYSELLLETKLGTHNTVVPNYYRLENKGNIDYFDPYTEFSTSKYSKTEVALGGVIGANSNVSYEGSIHDLVNRGTINVSGGLGNSSYIGGCIGRPSSGDGKNFYNYGKITAKDIKARYLIIGGVFGWMASVKHSMWENAHNYGAIEVKNVNFFQTCIGGTIGGAMSDSKYELTNHISNSSNNAPITISEATQLTGHTSTAYFRVGGFAAWVQHNMTNCHNNKEGEITIDADLFNAHKDTNNLCIGGLVGYKTVWYNNNCSNNADLDLDLTVTTNDTWTAYDQVCLCVGGLFGWKGDRIGNNCVNNGNISIGCTSPGRLILGGISGRANTDSDNTYSDYTWSDCTNNGNITIKEGTAFNHQSEIGGVFGYLQSSTENMTNNGNITLCKNYPIYYESYLGGVYGRVAAFNNTNTNIVNKGNLDFSSIKYTAVAYIGGCIGYAKEVSNNMSFPKVDGIHNYGTINIGGTRPARTAYKDTLTAGATIAIGNIGAFLGGILNDATAHEGADITINFTSMTNFTPKNATSADKGNVQVGTIAFGMKDYATKCVNHGNVTVNGVIGGTLYMGMFGGPYNYSRINCVNYGDITINANIKTNCFPSHFCYDGAANTTWQDCHNHGDIILGSKTVIANQYRCGMFYSKLETASKTNVLDNCSNSGNHIIEKGATIKTEARIGGLIGCHLRGIALFRNNVINTGNITFSGNATRNLYDKPVCLGGLIGNSAYNGSGDTNAAGYAIAADATIGNIKYAAGSWTGVVKNSGKITFDGESTMGVAIGGIIGFSSSFHSTAPLPTGTTLINEGDIVCSGKYALSSRTATDNETPKACYNGIGGILGYTSVEARVVDNAKVFCNIQAVNYPSAGLIMGNNRTDAVKATNAHCGGSIAKRTDSYENSEGTMITGPVFVTLDAGNYNEYIYPTEVTADVATADKCGYISAIDAQPVDANGAAIK